MWGQIIIDNIIYKEILSPKYLKNFKKSAFLCDLGSAGDGDYSPVKAITNMYGPKGYGWF